MPKVTKSKMLLKIQKHTLFKMLFGLRVSGAQQPVQQI